jgi:hypothetical protein
VCVDDWEGMVRERKLDHLRGMIDLIMGVRWRCGCRAEKSNAWKISSEFERFS